MCLKSSELGWLDSYHQLASTYGKQSIQSILPSSCARTSIRQMKWTPSEVNQVWTQLIVSTEVFKIGSRLFLWDPKFDLSLPFSPWYLCSFNYNYLAPFSHCHFISNEAQLEEELRIITLQHYRPNLVCLCISSGHAPLECIHFKMHTYTQNVNAKLVISCFLCVKHWNPLFRIWERISVNKYSVRLQLGQRWFRGQTEREMETETERNL